MLIDRKFAKSCHALPHLGIMRVKLLYLYTSCFILVDLFLLIPQWMQICYFFYKNIAFGFTLFWFEAYASFSGQPAYNDWYMSCYNVFFTSLPVIALGVFDQDVSARLCLKVKVFFSSFHLWRIFYRKWKARIRVTYTRIHKETISLDKKECCGIKQPLK